MKREYSESFKDAAGESESSSSEDDENAELLTEELEEGFFKVLSRLKKKDKRLYEENIKFFSTEESASNKKNKQKSDKAYKDWLKGQKDTVDDEVKSDLEALHDFWVNPNLTQEDQFLRDYILNKKFLDHDENFSIEKELEKLDEEEREFQEEVIFEHKYNNRFENADEEFGNATTSVTAGSAGKDGKKKFGHRSLKKHGVPKEKPEYTGPKPGVNKAQQNKQKKIKVKKAKGKKAELNNLKRVQKVGS